MTSAPRITAHERATVLNALSSALKNVSSLEVDGGILAQVRSRLGGIIYLINTCTPREPTAKILLQAWMPDGEELHLHTKGLPFSLIGSGDMLALFRCLSCKFTFSTDLGKLALMGSPGRVFSTGEAETSDNVQQYDLDIYLRKREAQACRIYSTVHLPLFGDASRSRAIAVLEITQFRGSSSNYQAVFNWSRQYLQAAGVYLPRHMETQTFEMQSHAMSIRFSQGHASAFGKLFALGSASGRGVTREGAAVAVQDMEHVKAESQKWDWPMQDDLQLPQDNSAYLHTQLRRTQTHSSGEGSEADNEASAVKEPAALQDDQQAPGSSVAAAGKSLLTKADLENNFAYSLSDAARRLGVSNTTVKRACRRYGFPRWPRQEIRRAAAAGNEAADNSQAEKPSRRVTHDSGQGAPMELESVPIRPPLQLTQQDIFQYAGPSDYAIPYQARTVDAVFTTAPQRQALPLLEAAQSSGSTGFAKDPTAAPVPTSSTMDLLHQNFTAIPGHTQFPDSMPQAAFESSLDLPQELAEEGLGAGSLNLDPFSVLTGGDMALLPDWPSNWTMDMCDMNDK